MARAVKDDICKKVFCKVEVTVSFASKMFVVPNVLVLLHASSKINFYGYLTVWYAHQDSARRDGVFLTSPPPLQPHIILGGGKQPRLCRNPVCEDGKHIFKRVVGEKDCIQSLQFIPGCISQLKISGNNERISPAFVDNKVGVTGCETCAVSPCENGGVCQGTKLLQ